MLDDVVRLVSECETLGDVEVVCPLPSTRVFRRKFEEVLVEDLGPDVQGPRFRINNLHFRTRGYAESEPKLTAGRVLMELIQLAEWVDISRRAKKS